MMKHLSRKAGHKEMITTNKQFIANPVLGDEAICNGLLRHQKQTPRNDGGFIN